MAWIWTGSLLLSILFSCHTANWSVLSASALEGAGAGVTLAISLAGPVCLWAGWIKTMESIGWSEKLSTLLTPFLRWLFPQSWQDPTIRAALCENISANLLGLGNAATEPGIRAARQMASASNGQASDELCRLVIMNTASVQLIPTSVAAVRASLGAASPFDILPAVWITSLCSVAVGLCMAKLFSRWVP